MSDSRLLRQQRVVRKKVVQIGKASAVAVVEPLEIMDALQPPGKEPQEDAQHSATENPTGRSQEPCHP